MLSNQGAKPKKSKRVIRRFELMGVDLLITTVSFFVSWAFLRQDVVMFSQAWYIHLPITLCVTGLFLLLFRCYDSLWRYEESREYLMQFLALTCSHSVLAIANYLIFMPNTSAEMKQYPERMQLMIYLISLLTMWLFRFCYRYVRGVIRLRQYNQRVKVQAHHIYDSFSIH